MTLSVRLVAALAAMAALAGGWYAGLGGVAGADGASVTLVPASQVTTVGSIIEFEVQIADTPPLGAYEFQIEYDPEILQYQGVGNGAFLGSSGRFVTCPAAILAEGAVRFGCNTSGAGGGPEGSGTLAKVRLEAVGAGTTDVIFTRLELGDALANVGIPIGDFGTGAVEVVGAGEPTPTAKPDTPTPDAVKLTPTPHPDQPTPERGLTINDPIESPDGSGTTGGSGDAAGDDGNRSGVIGRSAEAAGRGNAVAGVATGSSGGTNSGTLGPDGVPVAGSGPADRDTSRAGLYGGLLALVFGAGLAAGGFRVRRRSID